MRVGQLYYSDKTGTTIYTSENQKTCSYVMYVSGASDFVVNNLRTYGGINVAGSTATINNLQFSGTKFYAVCSQSGADVTINGGTYNKAIEGATNHMFWVESGSTMNITGGNYVKGATTFLNGNVKPVITGGKFDFDPTNYGVADGYEAVSITNEAPYTHQVGKITTKPLTANEGATDFSATYAAQKTVVDEAGIQLTPAETPISVTVTANQTETSTEATAKISNITTEALRDVVGNAADKAGDANVQTANVKITVAKSDPDISPQGKATFEVHPEAVITVDETVTTVPLTNAQITGSFSFALYLGTAFPDSTKDFVVVHVHENGTKENLGVFTTDNNREITLSNIKQFSNFEVSPLVLGNPVGENFHFEGGSLRRRVKTIDGVLTDEVIRGFTDFRFGYQITDYNASNQEVSYYFQWSKDGENWSKAIPATHIDAQGHVSLVITSVPQSWYGRKLYSRLCIVDADGKVTMSATNERTVNQVADYYIDHHTEYELRWVNYAKLLRGSNDVESYYVVRDAQTNAIIGHKLNSSDDMISDGTMSQ
jgi:hypothetical protein